MMTFDQFIKACQVWHLGNFWHIHVNTQIKDLYPSDKTDNLVWHNVWNYIQIVSSKTTKPIQWSSSRDNSSIVWTTYGQRGNPYGPDLYGGDNGLYINTTPTTHEITELLFDHRKGQYTTHLSYNQPSEGMISVLTQQRCSLSVIPEYNTKITTYDDLKSRHQCMQNLAVEEHRPIQYYSAIISNDHNMSPFSSEIVKINGHHNGQFDVDVVEQGSLQNDGTPQLIRYVRERILHWGNVRSGYSTQTPYHRTDGPAEVILYNVKDTIIGNTTRTKHIGGHKHQWYIYGNAITQTSIDKWIKHHGVIMHEGHHGYQSAFLNEMDKMAIIASPPIC